MIVLLLVAAGYLAGSVNYAILVTRLVAGVDIRTVGNRNPGTANVARNVGRGWAAGVFVLDLFKGLGPMLLASWVYDPASSVAKHAVIALVGLAAIVGHCKPVFFGFRGGGGIATSIGVYAFFAPAELVVSLLIGFLLAMLFFRSAEHTLGQWTPILFVTVLPFLTLAVNGRLAVQLVGRVTLGGHPSEVPWLVLGIALAILGLNYPLVARVLGGGRAAER